MKLGGMTVSLRITTLRLLRLRPKAISLELEVYLAHAVQNFLKKRAQCFARIYWAGVKSFGTIFLQFPLCW